MVQKRTLSTGDTERTLQDTTTLDRTVIDPELQRVLLSNDIGRVLEEKFVQRILEAH